MQSDNIRTISRIEEIEIPDDSPFMYDKLERAKYVETLTQIIEAFGEKGCVMSLSGDWGCGKTTFVKMWQKQLSKDYTTLYYNAWQNDFVEDPIIALVSELKEIGADNSKFRNIITKLGRFFLAIGKDLLKNTTNVDLGAIEDIGNDSLKQYAEQKTTIDELKKALSEYVASNTKKIPIVFFIDELDRCNPTFAVKTLERIKHLFDIPNIFFVLSISKKPLEAAIKGYYGSSEIDANEYLRRFIDFDFPIPQPELDTYCSYLLEQYNYESFFTQDRNSYNPDSDYGGFKTIVIKLCKLLNLNLRLVNKLLLQTRLATWGCEKNDQKIIGSVFFLCLWRITDTLFYERIVSSSYSLQELLEECEKRLQTVFNNLRNYQTNQYRYLLFQVVEFILRYNYTNGFCHDENFKQEVRTSIQNNFENMPLIPRKLDVQVFNEALVFYIDKTNSYNIESGLTHLISKINYQYGLKSL